MAGTGVLQCWCSSRLRLLTKLSVGYLFAGKAGVTLFGPNYTSTAHAAVAASGRYLELLALSIQNVKGHALAMCLMFGDTDRFRDERPGQVGVLQGGYKSG